MTSRVLVFAAFFLLASVLVAQTVSTQILGLVTDSSGALIAGVTVTAKRPATNGARQRPTKRELHLPASRHWRV